MKNKKIAVLLPFKDHFTRSNAGSASIWIKDFNKNSLFKNNIKIYGNTDNLGDVIDKKNYKNINFNSHAFKSKNISYVDNFIKLINNKFDLIEIHNRPSYVHYLLKKKISTKIVLIFHNNPLTLGGSKSASDRKELLNKCEKLIFVSCWVMEKFFDGLSHKSNVKCIVIYPSIQPMKKFPNKKNIISFVGK